MKSYVDPKTFSNFQIFKLTLLILVVSLTFTTYRYSAFFTPPIKAIYFIIIILLSSCNNESNIHNIQPAQRDIDSRQTAKRIQLALLQIDSLQSIVRTGDLILRTGNDFTSESLRSLNQRNQDYSHCGIASIEHDSIFVYHALGGDFNPDQKIRRDPLKVFGDPSTNRRIAVYHYLLSDSALDNIATTAKLFYKMGIMFDMKFDLASNDRMYCAEFVYKTLLLGSNKKLQFNISHIKDFRFIGVDDLFLQPQCRERKIIVYK